MFRSGTTAPAARATQAAAAPATTPLLACADVHGHVRRICFKTGPPGRVGIEPEWIVVDPRTPERPVPLPLVQRLCREAGPTPGGSRLTFEPGGQVELSSPPAPDAIGAVVAMRRDVTHLVATLGAAGLTIVPRATDPWALRPRQLRLPRYDAMERYFDALGHDHGPSMMRATASIQVNLGEAADAHCAPVADAWDVAARAALRDGDLARAARGLFSDAVTALSDRGDAAGAGLVADYTDRYVNAGRSPADDSDTDLQEDR